MTAETNAAALAEQITSRLDELLSVRDNISVSACRETVLGLLRAGAAKVPQFDLMAPGQEELVMKFCHEIAGPRGGKGRPPDPVRLLEMAQALYKIEMAATPPAPDAGVVESKASA